MSRLLKILSFALLLALGQNALVRWSEVAAAVRTAPGVAQTSGCEEESFFALWRTVHAGTPYLDSLRLPYASAYFNWLFYHGYALVLAPVVAAQGDTVIPAASRALTFAGALAGAAFAALLFRRILTAASSGFSHLSLPAAALLFFGPLAGWWSFTARPDVWALACETLAVTLCLLTFQRRSRAALVACTLALYAAWSFKQNYIVGLGAILTLQVMHGRWRDAGLMAALSAGLWLATASLLGAEYRACIANATSSLRFYPGVGISNLTVAVLKAGPLFLFLPWALTEFIRIQRGPLATDLPSLAIQLGVIGTCLGLLLAFPSSFALGATPNYYFSSALFAALAAVGGLARWHRPRRAAVFLGAGLLPALAPVVGLAHPISLAGNVAELSERWTVWSRQPEPRFSSDLRLNLPWLAPSSPPLVLAYKYPAERDQGRSFEHGGVGGLIGRGHFRSLLLPASTGTSYDGSDLARYERIEELGSVSLYRLKEGDRPPR